MSPVVANATAAKSRACLPVGRRRVDAIAMNVITYSISSRLRAATSVRLEAIGVSLQTRNRHRAVEHDGYIIEQICAYVRFALSLIYDYDS